MNMLFKSTIAFGLIITGLLFSCKKQDGYSDEIQTNPNPVTIDSTGTSSDSASINNTGPAGTNAVGGGGDKGAGNSGAQSINAGNAESGNTGSGNTGSGNTGSGNTGAKGTGTGSGPGPSAKDGSAYAGPSDPTNFQDTVKKGKNKKAVKTQK